MRKGKLGITTTTYAVIAFVLALFGQMLLCGLLLGFVLLVEKDEWLSRQCLQAFFLTFCTGVIAVVAVVLGMFGVLLGAGGAIGATVLFALIPGLLSIAVVVFSIIGLVNVSKGREANLPIISGLANRAFGRIPQPPQYPQGGYYAPQGQQQPPYGQQQPPMGQPYGQQQPPMGQQPPMSGQSPYGQPSSMGQPYGQQPPMQPPPPMGQPVPPPPAYAYQAPVEAEPVAPAPDAVPFEVSEVTETLREEPAAPAATDENNQ